MSVSPFRKKTTPGKRASGDDGALPKWEFPKKRRARRHLGDVSDADWELLMETVTEWLVRVDVPGSIAYEYDLYRALHDERALAQHRRTGKGGRS